MSSKIQTAIEDTLNLSKLKVRRAKMSDLDLIKINEEVAYNIPWSKELLNDCLTKGEYYICFVMLHENNIIGHMIFQLVLDEIHLHNVCVVPKFQQQGFGHIWIDYLYDYANKKNVRDIILEVRVSNLKAKKLYAGRGFREIGLRKNYYQAAVGKEDALVMKARVE